MSGAFAQDGGSAPADAAPVSVSRLTREIRRALQAAVPPCWVRAEISNLTRSAAGHLFATLKDDAAQMRAVVWRDAARRIPFEPQNGMKVLAFGRVEVYAGRGQYQLAIERLLPEGIGPHELAFRQLKAKLEREGLFDPRRKRPLRPMPSRIALVTSPRGAAVRDFIEVTLRRWPGAEILVVAVPVQGEGAAQRIVAGLELAGRAPRIDALALVRGGGSREDLAAFDAEEVARAIVASPKPVVCGVGHEVDVTIADLVADVRALTPSEAAERIWPDALALASRIERLGERLTQAAKRRLAQARDRLDSLAGRAVLADPRRLLSGPTERLDRLGERLGLGARRLLERAENRLRLASGSLDAVSPIGPLRRGFALAFDPDGRPIRAAADSQEGASADLRFGDGSVPIRFTGPPVPGSPGEDPRKIEGPR